MNILEKIDQVLNEGKFDKIDKKDLFVMGSILNQISKGDSKKVTTAEMDKLYDLYKKYDIEHDRDKKTIDPKFKKFALDNIKK